MPRSLTSPPVLEYRIGDQDVISPASVVESFEFSSVISPPGADVHQVTIANPQFQGFNAQRIQERQEISFRFGWAGEIDRAPIRRALLVDYDVVFEGRSSRLTITGADKSVEINRGTRNQAYVEKPISSIVQEIAGRNGVSADIEETRGAYTLRQVWISDIQFITRVLLPKAISAKTGRGDYDLYFDGKGVLHFHPPKLGNQVYKKYTLSDGGGPISKFRVFFRGEYSNAAGGLSTTAFGYDPFEKRTLQFTARDTTTREKDPQGTKSFLFSLPRAATDGRFLHNGYPITQSGVENEAKAQFYAAHRKRYGAVAVMTGDPFIEPGKQVSIQIPTDAGGRFHLLSGRYLVEGVRHLIDADKFVSVLSLTKSAAADGEETVSGVRPGVIQEEVTSATVREAVELP